MGMVGGVTDERTLRTELGVCNIDEPPEPKGEAREEGVE